MRPPIPSRRRVLRGLACLPLLLRATPLRAHEYSARNFVLMHPWADPMAPGVTQARVFFTIESVEEGDTLLGAHCDLAESAELRASADDTAPPLASLPVPAGPLVDFSPGHPHVLLKGLRQRFQFGRSYLLTLDFEKAGKLTVQVSVGAH
jgi:copper(I)-binding protein